MSSARRVTLRDIAARIGVSHVTVSLALKNHPDISRQRCDQVQALAREMGYRPDPALASLMVYRQGRRSAAVSSVIAWVSHADSPSNLRRAPRLQAYRQGACETAERLGYHLEEFIYPQDRSPEEFEKTLQTRNVRGILILPYDEYDGGSHHLENFSAIRLGGPAGVSDTRAVVVDYLRVVIMAMRRIRDYGYERIGFIMEKGAATEPGESLLSGYFAAQHMFRLPDRLSPLIIDAPMNEWERTLKPFELWYQQNKPDAILMAAPEVTGLLCAANLSIPGDVAVACTSVDDLSTLAGINQNSVEIGRCAVEALVALINNNDRGRPASPRCITVDGRWQDGMTMPKLMAGSRR